MRHMPAALVVVLAILIQGVAADEPPTRNGAGSTVARLMAPVPPQSAVRQAAAQAPASGPETLAVTPAPLAAPPSAAVFPSGPGSACGPPGRVWVSGEYLLWWIRGAGAPPLVTASPAGTPRELAGVLPGATVLSGGSALDSREHPGARFQAGAWLNEAQTLGLEGSFFFLAQQNTTFRTGVSNGDPILGRPVFNALTGTEDAELVAFPGVLNGGVTVSSFSRLWGADGNLVGNVACGRTYRVDVLGGYRYLRLDEGLAVTENLSVPAGPSAGSRIVVGDQFHTRNNFHGGQLGLKASFWGTRLGVDLIGKVALGVTDADIRVSGQTAFYTAGGTFVQPGGLLALPSNIGSYSRNLFAVAPEATFRVGYRVTDTMKLFVGYTFLYLSDVARPGDQIDRVVNRSQLPDVTGPRPLVGPARPQPLLHDTDFWAQGINFGLEWRF